MAVVDAMLDMARVRKDDVLYDLGCGDGRIVVRAASRFGCKGVGVDLNPQRVDEARDNARREKVEGLTRFEVGDVFEFDFSPATVVTMYLLPVVNLKLRPRLLKELKPGSRIVSHDFDMGDWKPRGDPRHRAQPSLPLDCSAPDLNRRPAANIGRWSPRSVFPPLQS